MSKEKQISNETKVLYMECKNKGMSQKPLRQLKANEDLVHKVSL